MCVVSTVVKATCNLGCGDVRVDISKVTLRYMSNTMSYEGAEYRFICPQCHRIVLKDTTPEIANVLYTAGAHVERYELSLEILERPQEIDAAPISDDDIIDLGLSLEQDEQAWWDRILGGENEE